MERVSVNKGILIALVGVAAASLLVVAFLLGRESRSASGAAAPPGRSLPHRAGIGARPDIDAHAGDAPPGAPPATASASDPVALAPASTAPALPERPAPLPPSTSPTPATDAGERGRGDADPARTAVAAYLDAIDHIQPGKMSGDAESVGNEMAAALARGDTSGLDRMIEETEASKASLVKITPPAPCVNHHRESVASLDDALEMLRSLKRAMGSAEPAAELASLTTRANALRSRAEAIQREEQALRQRYGLTR